MVKTRNKPFYSRREIARLVDSCRILLEERARIAAERDFGWKIEDIAEALKNLPPGCCYKSETRYDNPEIWVDFYRVYGLMGEDVFTHFYVENGYLVVDSFKELKNEMS